MKLCGKCRKNTGALPFPHDVHRGGSAPCSAGEKQTSGGSSPAPPPVLPCASALPGPQGNRQAVRLHPRPGRMRMGTDGDKKRGRPSFRPPSGLCLFPQEGPAKARLRFRLTLAFGLVEDDLAQADGLGCHFDVFVLLDVFERFFERENDGRRDGDLVVRTARTHIGEFL